MKCVTIYYPNKDGAKFDFDYYVNKHIPMAAKLFGDGIEIRKGISTPEGAAPPFICVLNIPINSVEEFLSTMEQHGAELIADIQNYTNIEPIVQFDEVFT